MIKRCLCSSVLHTGNAKHTFICSLCLDPDAFAENRIGDIWWCHSVMEKICTWSQTGGGGCHPYLSLMRVDKPHKLSEPWFSLCRSREVPLRSLWDSEQNRYRSRKVWPSIILFYCWLEAISIFFLPCEAEACLPASFFLFSLPLLLCLWRPVYRD